MKSTVFPNAPSWALSPPTKQDDSSAGSSTMPSASFQPLLDAALADYAKQIGIDPVKHPFVDQLQSCHSPDDVLKLLEAKANEFKDFRDGNRKLIDCLNPVVKVIHAFSGIIGQATSFVPFPPAGAIFAGLDILLATASDVSSSYDALVDLFECIGNFLKRLRIYTDLPLSPSMVDIIVKIMVELLSVLALATKQTKQGRFKKFAKKLLGESEIEAVLQRLDRLTQEEGRMTMVQTLEVVHGLMNNVKVVMNDGKASMEGIWRALDTMQQMASDINKIRRDQLQKDSRNWLSPPDPSPNYNTACEIHQDGTATWFFQGNVFTEWNAKGSLLWIYGKAGSGKSILMSSIIREVNRMRKAGLASMAYFYFDFRDTQKQDRHGLLSSLLSQLSAESDPCYQILSQLYSDHSGGTRQPSDDALFQCLVKMLQVQGEPATYVIIDALDESPNISGMPTAREKVLESLEDLVSLQLPNVHICLSSRPEFDIRSSLEPLLQFHVSLDEETGQKADISGYIKSVVHSDRRMRKWSAEDKQLVISTLSDKADGMFRWVYCQLEILRRCFPSSIRGTLECMPKTLDATYEHMLLGIDEEKWEFAHRLFRCLAVSVTPLRVEDLAEIMALRFDGGVHPQFNAGWQLDNAEESVLSACSSLVIVTNVTGSQIVQFAHFSVKEFLTSDRLTAASENLSRYHIVPDLAHTTLAQASLGVLLQLDDRIDKEGVRNFPLSAYAARHWFDHCRFGSTSPNIQDAMKLLFDREKPYFSAWIWIFDIDDPWRESMPTKHPERPEASPLYYAILCGFLWLIEHLIVTYPGDVDARGGYYGTPLHVAIRKEDVHITSSHDAGMRVPEKGDMRPLHRTSSCERIDIVQLLLKHNVDVHLPNDNGKTPLHHASASGKLEISRLLVQWGADVQARDKDDWTPLLTASSCGHLGIAQFLIDSGADVNPQNDAGWTPLHSASQLGHIDIVGLLIQRGADVNKQDENQETPLKWASASCNLEIARRLVQAGADVQARNKDNGTLLQTASRHGHLVVARFLIDSGADVNSHDNGGSTALHSASWMGYFDVVELLIQHRADVNKQDENHVTPLYAASASGNLDISRLLVQQGADVQSRTSYNWTPLHAASQHGRPGVVQFLIDNGADVNSQNKKETPLQLASRQGHVDVVELLIQHGADVNLPNEVGQTPLYHATMGGSLEVSRLLVQKGADVHSRRNDDWTPLHTASFHGHLSVVRFLIDSGADVNTQESEGWTPLHSAAYSGYLDVVKVLLEDGADFSIRDDSDSTPFDTAFNNEQPEVADFLSTHMTGSVPLDRAVNTTSPTVIPRRSPPGAFQPLGKLEDGISPDDEQLSLYTASENGQVDIVRSLLDRGSDVNERNSFRATPLAAASMHGHLEVADLLIERGADVDSRDRLGRTPLLVAADHTQFEVVRLLLDNGADVNAQMRNHDTALHLSSCSLKIDMAQLLLERGANLNALDADGKTPRQVAQRRGNRRVSELLLRFEEHGRVTI